jgi:hypothetical protein
MSVWNNLGKLYKGTLGWIGDVAQVPFAPAKFVWDVFTAPLNDRPEYNGLVNTLQQAGTDFTKTLARPIGGVGAAVLHTTENIRQVGSAAMLYAGQSEQQGLGTDAFKKAWEAKDEISIGESAASFFGANFKLLPDSISPEFLRDNFNIYDPDQRKSAFHNSIMGKVVSGSLDFTAQIFLDPTLVAGKAVKAYKAADTAMVALNEINSALLGTTNKYSKLADDFAANDEIWAKGHQWVRDGNDQATSSYLLGQTKTKEEALHTMKALLGDNSGAEALKNIDRIDLARPLALANGELSPSQLNSLLREEIKFNSSQTEDMLSFGFRTPEEIAADQEYIIAWAKNDKYVDTLFDISAKQPMLEGIGKNQRLSREIATARSMPYHSKQIGYARQDVYQPTKFHALYSKISWLEGERPSGIVNLNEGDSIREVSATVDRLIALSATAKAVPSETFVRQSAENTFTREQGAQFIKDYAAAVTPEARAAVVNRLERIGYHTLAEKYGVSSNTAETLFNTHVQLRAKKLGEIKETGFLYDNVENRMHNIPLFESQGSNFLPIADFDTVNKVLYANKNAFVEAALNAEHVVQTANDLWKAGVLLRLGYPIRNAIDSQLRIWTTVGALATLRHVKEGTSNIFSNAAESNMGTRVIDRFSGVSRPNAGELLTKINALGKKISLHNSNIVKLNAELNKLPGDADLVGKIALEMDALKATNAAYDATNKTLGVIENARGTTGKKFIGRGKIELESKYTDINGYKYQFNDSFGNPQAELYRGLNSSEKSMQSLLSDFATLHGASLKSRGTGAILPENPTYYYEWAHALNTDFINSAVVRKLIAGEDPIVVAKWLEDNPGLRSRLNLSRNDSMEHVRQVSTFVDSYIPKGYGIREKMLQTGDNAVITPEYLRATIKDPKDLPIVHGALIDENIRRTGAGTIKQIIDASFKYLGSKPEDAWARHPLFTDLYRKSVQKRIDTAEFLNKGQFTREEFDKIQYEIESGARADALKGVKAILYNVERRSNAAHLLKFISPFFSAQENAVKTWLRIASTNPSIISRAGNLWTTPNRLGLATDSNGNPVPVDQAYSPDDMVWLPIPNALKKVPLLGQGLTSLDQIGLSKRSVDVIFQGSPLGLSVGPMAGILAANLIKLQPSFGDMTSFLFPYGPDASLSSMLPTWGRRAYSEIQGMNNADYAKTYQLIWLTEQHKSRDNNMPYLTDKQVKQKTDAFFNVRLAAAVILPFAPSFKSPYKHYIDKWHEYSTKYGINADSKFLADFPEFFDFATSMSKNETGIASDMNAVSNAKRYSSLISTLQTDNPALTSLVTNGTPGEFSNTASWWEEQQNIGPGSVDKFRGTVSPVESIAKNQARKGWAQYRLMTTQLDAALAKRGLTDVNQAGAEDLKAAKFAVIQAISVEYDPVTQKPTSTPSAWAIDYSDVDGLKAAKNINGLRKIVNNSAFMDINGSTPTWKSVMAYLQLRDSIAVKLSVRPSGGIDAKANEDLALQLNFYVNQLRRGDIKFADIYDRFLSQDKIYYKNLGLGA